MKKISEDACRPESLASGLALAILIGAIALLAASSVSATHAMWVAVCIAVIISAIVISVLFFIWRELRRIIVALDPEQRETEVVRPKAPEPAGEDKPHIYEIAGPDSGESTR